MNDLVLITGDLLLALIVFYGVLKLFNFFIRDQPSISSRRPLFPKVSAQQAKDKDDQHPA